MLDFLYRAGKGSAQDGYAADGTSHDLPILVVAALGAIGAGVLASTGNPLYAGALGALAIAVFIVGRPTYLLWLCVLGGLVLMGTTRLYLPAIQQIRWVLAPLSLLLVAHAILALFERPALGRRAHTPPIIGWAVAFMLVLLFSTLVNGIDLNRLTVGMKGYFQVWGLLFALAYIQWRPATIDALPKVLIGVALLQLPFVLHQWIVLVPSRMGLGGGVVAVDVIAGTFGASLEGGGANAILAAFMVMILAGFVAAVQERLFSPWWLLLFAPLLLFPILVNMAKVSILYLLTSFVILFSRDIVAHPLRFVGGVIAMLVVAAALFTAFTLNAPEQAGVKDWRSLIRYTYETNIAEEELGGQLTRASVLTYWADQHWPSDIQGILIGHGVGVSRVADANDPTETTVSVRRQGIPSQLDISNKPGATTVAAVLWEGGLLALLCLFGLLTSTYVTARRLSHRYADVPARVAAFRTVQVAMVIIAITLFHKNMFVFDVIYQTLLMVLIGYVAFWDRQSASLKECAGRGSRGPADTVQTR